MHFLLQTVVTGLALWLTTLLVPGIVVTPYDNTTLAWVLTFLLVGAIFGIVNSTVGLVLRIVSIPLYILTLGLFSLIVNGLLLMLSGWVSRWFGFGLSVESFWWGVWGAVILGIVSWILGLFIRPARA